MNALGMFLGFNITYLMREQLLFGTSNEIIGTFLVESGDRRKVGWPENGDRNFECHCIFR